MARYVYVLVTGDINRYATMAFLSALSVRGVDRDARITLLSDEPTVAALRQASHRLLPLVDDLILTSDQGPSKLISRVLKTTMLQRVQESFIFLDVDTLAIGDLTDRANRAESLQMALDRLPRFPEPIFPKWFVPSYEKLGWPHPTRHYYNSGVMYVRNNADTGRFFEEWHSRWRQYVSVIGKQNDQPALNSAVEATDVRVGILPIAYNAMVQVRESFRHGARLLHFFADRYGTDEGTEYQRLIQRAEAGDEITFAEIKSAMRRRWPLVEPWSVRRHLAAGSYWGAWQTWRDAAGRQSAARQKAIDTHR